MPGGNPYHDKGGQFTSKPKAVRPAVAKAAKAFDAALAADPIRNLMREMGAMEFEQDRRERPDLYDTHPKSGFSVRNDKPAPKLITRAPDNYGEGEFPMIADHAKGPFGMGEKAVGPPRPLPFVYRAISEEEYQSILKTGFMQSDGRMNLSQAEGTVTALSDPTFYLPGKLASNPDGDYPGRVIKIALRPEDGWKLDRDGYVKTSQPVSASQIVMVSPPLVTERRSAKGVPGIRTRILENPLRTTPARTPAGLEPWQRGKPGKAFVMPDGSVLVWRTEVPQGRTGDFTPSHPDLPEDAEALINLFVFPNGHIEASSGARPGGRSVEELIEQAVAAIAGAHRRGPPRRFAQQYLQATADSHAEMARATFEKQDGKQPKKKQPAKDDDFESKHPRSHDGATGGQFIKGSGSSDAAEGVRRKLGVKSGEDLTKAVKAYQRKHGLKVDGIVGRQTAAALRGNKDAASVDPGELGESDRGALTVLARKNAHADDTEVDQMLSLADLPELTAADGGDQVSRGMRLMRVGSYTHPKWQATIGPDTFDSFLAHFASRGRLPIDFDHAPERGGSTEAAGWITELRVEGDDLLADIEWTELGASAIKAKRYLFLSPTWNMHAKTPEGEQVGPRLAGAAMTNRPFFDLPMISLSQQLTADSLGEFALIAGADEELANEAEDDQVSTPAEFALSGDPDDWARQLQELNASLLADANRAGGLQVTQPFLRDVAVGPPIDDETQLLAAIENAETDEHKQHCVARAKALGLSDRLPDGWAAVDPFDEGFERGVDWAEEGLTAGFNPGKKLGGKGEGNKYHDKRGRFTSKDKAVAKMTPHALELADIKATNDGLEAFKNSDPEGVKKSGERRMAILQERIARIEDPERAPAETDISQKPASSEKKTKPSALKPGDVIETKSGGKYRVLKQKPGTHGVQSVDVKVLTPAKGSSQKRGETTGLSWNSDTPLDFKVTSGKTGGQDDLHPDLQDELDHMRERAANGNSGDKVNLIEHEEFLAGMKGDKAAQEKAAKEWREHKAETAKDAEDAAKPKPQKQQGKTRELKDMSDTDLKKREDSAIDRADETGKQEFKKVQAERKRRGTGGTEAAPEKSEKKIDVPDTSVLDEIWDADAEGRELSEDDRKRVEAEVDKAGWLLSQVADQELDMPKLSDKELATVRDWAEAYQNGELPEMHGPQSPLGDEAMGPIEDEERRRKSGVGDKDYDEGFDRAESMDDAQDKERFDKGKHAPRSGVGSGAKRQEKKVAERDAAEGEAAKQKTNQPGVDVGKQIAEKQNAGKKQPMSERMPPKEERLPPHDEASGAALRDAVSEAGFDGDEQGVRDAIDPLIELTPEELSEIYRSGDLAMLREAAEESGHIDVQLLLDEALAARQKQVLRRTGEKTATKKKAAATKKKQDAQMAKDAPKEAAPRPDGADQMDEFDPVPNGPGEPPEKPSRSAQEIRSEAWDVLDHQNPGSYQQMEDYTDDELLQLDDETLTRLSQAVLPPIGSGMPLEEFKNAGKVSTRLNELAKQVRVDRKAGRWPYRADSLEADEDPSSDSRDSMADLTKIAELLGLDPEADEYDVLTAAEALKERSEQPLKGVVTSPDGDVIMSAAQALDLQDRAARGDEADAELNQIKFDSAFDRAIRQGRAAPSARQHFQAFYTADSLACLKAIDELAPLVPVDPAGASGHQTAALGSSKGSVRAFSIDGEQGDVDRDALMYHERAEQYCAANSSADYADVYIAMSEGRL